MINLNLLNKYQLFKNEILKELTLLPNQGFNNINYLLKTSNKHYLIRVFGSNNSLHVNRKFEFKTLLNAFKKGISAQPLLLDKKNSLMICEYLEGSHKFALSKQDIKDIAILLRKFHQIKPNKKALDLKKSLHKVSSLKITKAFNTLKKYKKEYVLCHHDLNPKNFIFSDKIKLIDMEYADKDDKYFDLATVIIEFNLNKKEERLFLHSYFKNPFTANEEKLNAFKTIYIHLCLLWFEKNNNQEAKIKYKKELAMHI